MNKNLFISTMVTGYYYCDKSKEEHGDYMVVAVLDYKTLKLDIKKPKSNLLSEIKEHASKYKAGMEVSASATQTRILGE